jgi:imidazole glycerol-phosphate synthase subunit HisH
MSDPLRKIAIIDVGLGNIASIERMLQKVGSRSILVKKPDDLRGIEKVILPGVGHFDEGMKQLQKTGFAQALVELISDKNVQVMGICLGMQMLCRSSEEGSVDGLGLIDADVKKFRFPLKLKLKVPHMGWNVVSSTRPNHLLPVSTEEQRFYFVHSYRVVPDDSEIMIGTADYGGEFCAAFQQGNVFGVQFHPEKSHRFGMELMQRFVEF